MTTGTAIDRGMTRRRFMSAAAAGLAASRPLDAQAPLPPGFVRLFDGTLEGWTVENSQTNNFTVRDRILRVEGPQGWLRSNAQYGDFTLRVEVRFLTDDADSGIFLRAPGPASNVFVRGWPANAYQVQVRDMSRKQDDQPYLVRQPVPPPVGARRDTVRQRGGACRDEADRRLAGSRDYGRRRSPHGPIERRRRHARGQHRQSAGAYRDRGRSGRPRVPHHRAPGGVTGDDATAPLADRRSGQRSPGGSPDADPPL
jgi:Domain of Unknown Function (DUF1080)